MKVAIFIGLPKKLLYRYSHGILMAVFCDNLGKSNIDLSADSGFDKYSSVNKCLNINVFCSNLCNFNVYHNIHILFGKTECVSRYNNV